MNPLFDTLMNRSGQPPPPSEANGMWAKPPAPPPGPPGGPPPPGAPPMPHPGPPAPPGGMMPPLPVPPPSTPSRPPPEAQRAQNVQTLTKAYQNPSWSPNPVLLDTLLQRH